MHSIFCYVFAIVVYTMKGLLCTGQIDTFADSLTDLSATTFVPLTQFADCDAPVNRGAIVQQQNKLATTSLQLQAMAADETARSIP